jgi:hypothetical protein
MPWNDRHDQLPLGTANGYGIRESRRKSWNEIRFGASGSPDGARDSKGNSRVSNDLASDRSWPTRSVYIAKSKVPKPIAKRTFPEPENQGRIINR